MLNISVCDKKTTKKYKNRQISWEELIDRNRRPVRTSETIQEYNKMSKTKRDDIKDIGGFVGGWLRDGVRKNGNVISRRLGTLDADNITDNETFLKALDALKGVSYFIYSTHSSTTQEPRYRLVIRLDRDVSEEEYPALMRKVAEPIGMDYFDDTTYQANRMMYWSSCSSNADFYFKLNEGAPLNVDEYLGKYENWKDITQWPVSSRQSEAISSSLKKQQDPIEKPGIIGAFCRTYTITEAIDKYLSDVYVPSANHSNRYDYVKGQGVAGVVVYEDKWSYSHHGTDPASCILCNAYDLVRLHKFSELSDKESVSAMNNLALNDDKVKATLGQDQIAGAMEDFEDSDDSTDWIHTLSYDKKGLIKDTLSNLMIIVGNDKNLAQIKYDELRGSIVAKDVPWKQIKPPLWSDNDYAQLKAYIERKYGIYSPSKLLDTIKKVSADRAFHPIKDYLKSLPEWDKVKRLDTILIDYFGAEDNAYTRATMRKVLIAAIARVYKPGTKFDSVLILNGPQGIGKSTFFNKLAGEFYSDSLTMSDMRDKTGAEKLQGYWLIEISELAGLRKMEVEVIKGFISRNDDKYRAPYGTFVESHPRQCIIVGSTNVEDLGFLRDVTGNRRFWPIRVEGNSLCKSWDLTEETVQQIWAEALEGYKAKEKLYLQGEAAELAECEQVEAVEADERQGIVEEYLNTLLPANWEDLSVTERRSYLSGAEYDPLLGEDVDVEEGTVKRTAVSNIEIWCECFGKPSTEMKRKDTYEIKAIMSKIKGWSVQANRKRVKPYGLQRIYTLNTKKYTK